MLQMFRAKRKVEIVDNRPIVKHLREASDEDQEKIKSDKSEVARISSELTSFISGRSTSGLTMENGKVKIEITLSKFSLDIQKQLKELNVEKLNTIYVSNGVYKLTGFVSKESLEKIKKLSFVKYIKAAK